MRQLRAWSGNAGCPGKLADLLLEDGDGDAGGGLDAGEHLAFGERLSGWVAEDDLLAMASRKGLVGAHLLQPAPPPPMTREQSLRGREKPMPWLVIATGYDAATLKRAAAKYLDSEAFRDNGAAETITLRTYAIDLTATAGKWRARFVPGPESR